MKAYSGYDEAKVSTGSYEQLATGGHELIILSAKETELKGYPVLEIYFDTTGTDKQPSFYKESYDAAKDQFEDAKYQGIHNLFLPQEGEEQEARYGWALSRLKGLITSVEESNAGFKWAWNPDSLKNKRVGGVFGEEEYANRDGEIKTAVRLRYFCSTDSAKTAKAPKVKTLKNKPTPTPAPKQASISDADLPFEV